MARDLAINDSVYVPRARIGLDQNHANAFYYTKVRQVVDRSVKVDLPEGGLSEKVATSVVHRNVGLLIFRIGDYQTETSLLDPLAKSILQYFRLLVPDDMVQLCEIRTAMEFQSLWASRQSAFSHVVLIGHGRKDAILFGTDWIDAETFQGLIAPVNPTPKLFVSLCCRTAYAAFSKPFSEHAWCLALVAPFQSVHGAVASQFCQSYFAFHLLAGETPKIAFRHARDGTPGSTHFRLWERGQVTGGER